MTQFLFILGKNWQFSLCELVFVLKHLCLGFEIVAYSKNACLVDFPHKSVNAVPVETLQFYLGGTQKIAWVTGQYDVPNFVAAFPVEMDDGSQFIEQRSRLEQFLKKQVLTLFGPVQKTRYFFAHSIYPENFSSEFYQKSLQFVIPYLNNATEEILRKEGATKVTSYRYPEEPMRAGTLNPIFPHHVLRYNLLTPTRGEIIWALFGHTVAVGRTFAVTDPNYQKQLDEDRPFHRFEGSIPPKFAKAMLNFGIHGLKTSHSSAPIAFDPFCGSGTFLIFARLFELEVYGSDIDPACVEGSQANLAWFCKREDFPSCDWATRVRHVAVKDVPLQFPDLHPDAIVTEPFLVPPYREAPQIRDVKEIFQKTALPGYRDLFNLATQILPPTGRVCCSFPVIRCSGGEFVQLYPQVKADLPSQLKEMNPCAKIVARKERSPAVATPSPALGLLVRQKNQFVSREIRLFEKVV
jgi:hypothetical protein